VQAIEREIIPRLLLARRDDNSTARAPKSHHPALEDEIIEEFTSLILERGVAAASYVESLRTRGMSIEQLYLRLLAPAARLLGNLWDSDSVDFTEVTVGVGRLQLLLRKLSPDFFEESAHPQHGRRLLLLPAAGDQHSFGLIMVAEFFHRDGWEVYCDVALSHQDVVAIVRDQTFSLVGFSLSSELRLDALASQIRAVRRASLNRGIGVMVGGNVFVEHPEFVALIGADATAVDGPQAVSRAADMLSLLAIQC
jgi:methanogenic corrinoid protein MtbC1